MANTNGASKNGSPRRGARQYGRSKKPGTSSHDPALGVQDAPPNLGRDFIPHVVTFQGRFSLLSNVYKNPDEALRHSRDDARAMRKDLVIEECLEGRKLATAMLGWHLELEDDAEIDKESPLAKMILSTLTSIINRIPNFQMYRFSIMDAIWCGRQAIQHKYGVDYRRDRTTRKLNKQIVIEHWKPIHGDKLAFRYDDGSGVHSEDEVGIRVGSTMDTGDVVAGDRTIEFTDFGPAYFLEPWERPLLAVHKHIIEDGYYEDPLSAGRIHGVGIRDRIYWCWFQKQHALAQLMEVVERTGSGFYVFYFERDNAKSLEKMKEVAAGHRGSNYIMLPRTSGEAGFQDAEGIDLIPPNTAGIEALKTIIHDYFGHQIKRYILGQTLTSEAQATGLGSNVADMHYESLMRIRDFDSINLQETLTNELVGPLKRFNSHLWPSVPNLRVLFRIDMDSTESDKKLEAAMDAWQMGLRLPARHIYELCGCPEPTDEDEVLENPALMQQSRLREQQMQGGETDGAGAPEGSVEDLFGPIAQMNAQTETEPQPQAA